MQADRTGSAGQNQKRRLEGVVGRMFVAQRPPTNAEDERPVTTDQRPKRLMIPSDECAEQEGVGLGVRRLAAEAPDESIGKVRHGGPRGRDTGYSVMPGATKTAHHFSFTVQE